MDHPTSLLFVDDDAAYMAVAQHVLSSYTGAIFSVAWKQNADDALKELHENPKIEMVILDNYLPPAGGFELLKQMRARNINTPVVLLTSQREFQIAIEALRYGVEDYLLKDDAVGTLLPRTIINVLERSRLKRQILEQEKADLIAKKQTDAVKELVVTICHEFNNPLAAIKISTDIMMRQWLSDEERTHVAILDGSISRIEKGIQKLRMINFD